MRALAAGVLLALGSCAAERLPATTPPAPGVLTAIEAKADLDGNVIGASDKPTIVIVFASWCEHCRDELGVLDWIRGDDIRILGVNYKGHEDYAARGGSTAVRAFVRDRAKWLRVVPIEEELFSALGRPPL